MNRSMTSLAVALVAAVLLLPSSADAAGQRSSAAAGHRFAAPARTPTGQSAADSALAPAGRCAGENQIGGPAVQEDAAMACLVNWARVQQGLTTLTAAPQLAAAAQMKLAAEARANEFSHTPGGLSFLVAFTSSGYLKNVSDYRVGENLSWGQNDLGSPRSTMSAWLGSPEHRANLFDPRFREFGFAYQTAPSFLGYDGVSLWANTFGVRGTPTAQQPTAKPTTKHSVKPTTKYSAKPTTKHSAKPTHGH